jgi:hypothetical protein
MIVTNQWTQIINYKFRTMKMLVFLQCMVIGTLAMIAVVPVAIYDTIKP